MQEPQYWHASYRRTTVLRSLRDSPTRFVKPSPLDVGKRLSGGVADDEAGVVHCQKKLHAALHCRVVKVTVKVDDITVWFD